MRFFILLVLGVLLMQGSLLAGSDKPKVILRFHVQNTDLADVGKLQMVDLTDPPERIYVDRFAFLSEKYIQDAKMLQDGTILVQFDHQGTTALETTTSVNLGKILVVIFNGRMLMSPMIDKPLRGGRMLLPGVNSTQAGITALEYQEIQKLVKQRNSP